MKIPRPGVSHEKAFPDGNRRLALLGRFAVGLVFTENVNSGAKDAESVFLDACFSIGRADEVAYRFTLT